MMDLLNMLNPTDVLLVVCAVLLFLLLIELALLLAAVRQIRRMLAPRGRFPARTNAQRTGN